MKKIHKILLGIASFWPFLYIPMFMMFFFSTFSLEGKQNQEPPPGVFIFLGFHIFTVLLILGLSVFYIVYLFRTDKVESDKKALWAVVLFLGGIIANPAFWYLYIWREVKTAQPEYVEVAATGTGKIYCKKCGTLNDENNFKCTNCGFILHNIQAIAPAPESSAIGVIIPYKNGKALTSYYLGVFSAIPIIGIPLGLAAVWLGIKGRQAYVNKPELKGLAHAWAGMIMGSFFAGLYLVLGVWLFQKMHN